MQDGNAALRIVRDTDGLSPVDVADIVLLVAQHLSASESLGWLWLARRAEFRWPSTDRFTLSQFAAVTGVSKTQAKRQLEAIARIGLVTILHRDDGCRGGIELRKEHPLEVLGPGPDVIHGDPQRPLIDDSNPVEAPDPNVTVNPSLPLRSHHGHGESNSLPSHAHGHGHREVLTKQSMHYDHEGAQGNVPPDRDVHRLNQQIAKRKRELRTHVENDPAEARKLKQALGQLVEGIEDPEVVQRSAIRHKLICETIAANVRDADMAVGFVHDVADLIVTKRLPETVLGRIFQQINRRMPDNRGGYFRACINDECRSRDIEPPQARRP